MGHVGSRIRLLDKSFGKKHCVPSRGQSFDFKFMKLQQNVNHHNI